MLIFHTNINQNNLQKYCETSFGLNKNKNPEMIIN